MKLENKVAIITGGGSDIGHAAAEKFVQEGAKIVISDVNDGHLAEIKATIKVLGGHLETVHVDVRFQEDNDKMFAAALEKFEKYDTLFCNDGAIDGFRTVGNITNEIWDRTFDINIKGPMMQMRAAVNYLKFKRR